MHKKTNNALANIRDDVRNLKEQLTAKIDNMKIGPDQRIRRIEEDIELTKNEISKIDFKGLSEAFNTESIIIEGDP